MPQRLKVGSANETTTKKPPPEGRKKKKHGRQKAAEDSMKEAGGTKAGMQAAEAKTIVGSSCPNYTPLQTLPNAQATGRTPLNEH